MSTSLTSEDRSYLDAVKSGQMGLAERMVDAAALRAGAKTTAFRELPRVTQEDIHGEMLELLGEEIGNMEGINPRLTVRDMPVSSITGFRRSTSELAVSDYRAMLQDGRKAPPILVDGSAFVDGGHRFESHRQEGRTLIATVDVGPLIRALRDWGQGEIEYGVARDDNGNVIPLSEMFRESADTPEGRTPSPLPAPRIAEGSGLGSENSRLRA